MERVIVAWKGSSYLSISVCFKVWFLYYVFYLYFSIILCWRPSSGGLNQNICSFLHFFTRYYYPRFSLLHDFFLLSWLASVISEIINRLTVAWWPDCDINEDKVRSKDFSKQIFVNKIVSNCIKIVSKTVSCSIVIYLDKS